MSTALRQPWRFLGLVVVVGLLLASLPLGTAQAATTCPQGQFLAEYFDNRGPAGTLGLTRCESAINHDWKLGGPGGSLGVDHFYARWNGTIQVTAGTYTF